jgi:hypothetical protein
MVAEFALVVAHSCEMVVHGKGCWCGTGTSSFSDDVDHHDNTTHHNVWRQGQHEQQKQKKKPKKKKK